MTPEQLRAKLEKKRDEDVYEALYILDKTNTGVVAAIIEAIETPLLASQKKSEGLKKQLFKLLKCGSNGRIVEEVNRLLAIRTYG